MDKTYYPIEQNLFDVGNDTYLNGEGMFHFTGFVATSVTPMFTFGDASYVPSECKDAFISVINLAGFGQSQPVTYIQQDIGALFNSHLPTYANTSYNTVYSSLNGIVQLGTQSKKFLYSVAGMYRILDTTSFLAGN